MAWFVHTLCAIQLFAQEQGTVMSLIIRNIIVNIFYYGITVLMLPWLALSLEGHFGVVRHPSPILQLVSLFLCLIGAALQLWCIVLFQSIGAGTPSPVYPPEMLVVKGPYSWFRNPMNAGELIVLTAFSAWFASPTLLAYAISAAFVFHLFITLYEEPRNLTCCGEEYAQYCKNVNRWLPKLRLGS